MNYIQKLLLLVALIGTLSSCKNDLQVNASWKEITVVYGLLNPTDTAQYIKINKAYLGPGNELSYAKIADSINYPNILNVSIQRFLNGVPYGPAVHLVRDSSIVKDTGIFANVPNILYKWATPIPGTIDINSQYQLTIVNTQTGKTITGFTSIVGNIVSPNTPTIPWSSTTLSFTNHPNNEIMIGWGTAPSGKIYNMVIRIYYIENNIPKSLDWSFGNQESLDTLGAINNPGEALYQNFQGDQFYQFVGNELSDMPSGSRHLDSIKFIWSIGTLDLDTYIQVYAPSIGIVQEKPQYTDLSGGIGIFTSRSIYTSPLCSLSQNSKDTLVYGPFTVSKGFYY
jgi:hypothetical protein